MLCAIEILPFMLSVFINQFLFPLMRRVDSSLFFSILHKQFESTSKILHGIRVEDTIEEENMSFLCK